MYRVRARLGPWIWYTVLLVILSIWIFGRVAADPGAQVYAGNDDSSLFIWWLGHGAEVLKNQLGGAGVEGDFLYTELINAQGGGVNGAWNTSLLGFALLLAPVTWLAGPIISYNLIVMAIPVLNSLATAILFRRFLGRFPAFTAAAATGFSSYAIAQLSGHPNLGYAVTPPLVVAIILALLGQSRTAQGRWSTRRFFATRRWWILVASLGAVLAFQFYVSTEVLAGTFLAVVIFLIALVISAPKAFAPTAWIRMITAGASASVLAGICALPLLRMMSGPNAPHGAIRPHGVWNTDLLDLIVPALPTLLGTGSSPIPRVQPLDAAEIGAYLGIPALCALAIIVVFLWRSRSFAPVIRTSALAGATMFLFSLGSPVFLGGEIVFAVGPFALIEAIPVLNNILPMRLVLHSTIAACAILGCGLQWALHRARAGSGAVPRIRRGARGLLVLLAVSLVVVLPGVVPAREVYVPEFYHRSIDQVIPQGSVVKTLPRPLAWAVPHADEAMVWQAVSGFHYRETGGYFIGSSPESDLIYSAPRDDLDRLLGDSLISSEEGLPDPDSTEARETFAALRDGNVDFLVLAVDSPVIVADSAELEGFLTRGFGPPVFSGEGVRVYRLS